MTLGVAIELIIPDNAAFTVLTALRQLGYPELARVERAEHVVLHLDDNAAAPDVVTHLSRAEVLYNPNKHTMWYSQAGAAPAVPPEYEAYVRDKDENNERLVALLVTTFGIPSLRGLERAVAWRLYDDRGPATPQRFDWACQTLLSNSVSQVYEICPRPQRFEVKGAAALTSKAVK